MLPSLGFFGGTWGDCLDLHHRTRLYRLRVELVAPAPGFLNLRGVLARKDHRTVRLPEGAVHVEQSSDRPESGLSPQRLSRLTGIHTLKEQGSWWEVQVPAGVDIDQVVVFNRPDGLGDRARELRVTIWDDSDKPIVLYDSTTQDFLSQTVMDIARISGGQVDELQVGSPADGQKWRTEVVSRICNHVDKGQFLVTADAWRSLAALLPTRQSRKPGADLEGCDWKLLAYGLCAQLARDERSRSGVQAYSKVLNTPARLDRLEVEFDDATNALSIAPIHHVRHGLDFRARLNDSVPSIAKLVDILQGDLADLGGPPILAYGSLLGAVRDGHLLPHDDDFDVFVVIGADSVESFETQRRRLYSHLESRAWKVEPNGKYRNAHVSRANEPGKLDLFAVWDDGERAWTHMNRMAWEPLCREWFRDLETIEVDGIVIAAPKAAAEFLRARYGAGWTTPDKYYDWRWRLDA